MIATRFEAAMAALRVGRPAYHEGRRPTTLPEVPHRVNKMNDSSVADDVPAGFTANDLAIVLVAVEVLDREVRVLELDARRRLRAIRERIDGARPQRLDHALRLVDRRVLPVDREHHRARVP